MAKTKKRGHAPATAPHRPRRRPAQIAAALIAGLLAVLLFVSLMWDVVFAAAITQSEVDAIRKRLAAATAQKNELSAQITDISQDRKAVERQLSLLDEQIASAEEEIAIQEELLASLGEMIETKTLELADSEAREREQYATMKERVRFMAERGTMSYLQILLSADDFADFLYRYEVIRQVSVQDEQSFEALRAVRESVERQKAELEQTRAEEQETYASLEQNRAALENSRAAKSRELEAVEEMEQETREAYAALVEEEDKLMDDYKRAAAELAAQQTYVGGTFMWPLPRANNVVTCPYGYRTHPITGKYSLHTGVDLRATTGTRIYATNGGTVTTSAYSSVWGNYVIISHGGGYTSLYAHMSKRNCAKGDRVSQGDVIGYVGSTGYSTAPHLHFEMSKNGSTFNPLTEFKGFSVVYK